MLPFWYTRKHIEAADFYIILNIPYFLTNRRWNVCSRLKFKITFSNEASRFHPNEIKINRKTLVQTCSNLFKLVQTRSNSFKLVQTRSNAPKIATRDENSQWTREQTSSNAKENQNRKPTSSPPTAHSSRITRRITPIVHRLYTTPLESYGPSGCDVKGQFSRK